MNADTAAFYSPKMLEKRKRFVNQLSKIQSKQGAL